MAKKKINLTLDEGVIKRLTCQVPARQRSRFINDLVSERLTEMEEEALAEELRKGYIARAEEDEQTNTDWGSATVQSFP